MTLEEIKTRKAEIKASLEADGEVDVNALRSEIESLEVEERALIENAKAEAEANEIRKAEAEAEERRKMADAINDGSVRAKEIPQEGKKMEIELRNTLEYGKAFVKSVLHGDDTELRALLSTNVSGGVVPVPVQLETEIAHAWEEAQIARHAKRTNLVGNVTVGFELSATGAVVHVEGTDAPTMESLAWGVVTLKAENIKKWIAISDEAIENTTIDTLAEVYKELAYRIVIKAEEIAIGKITSAPTTSTATAVGVKKYVADTLGLATISLAEGELTGEATDLYLIMNRKTKAYLKGVRLNANYNADPFDGLEDKILTTDALPSYAEAEDGETYIIVGDLKALQFNFPNGKEMVIKTDDISLAEKDLVKVVGRQFVGIGVVAPYHFVNIAKAEA